MTDNEKLATAQANKQLMLDFYERVFNNWDLSGIDEVMWEDYMQHSPEVEDGREGFKKFFRGFIQAKPHADIVKVIAEDDLVCMFFCCTMGVNGAVIKVFDLYRIEDGKLAEHWDCTMNTEGIPVNNSLGHF